MIEVLTDFVAELKWAGLAVSPQETIDAAHAVRAIHLDDPESLRSALAATLLKSAEFRVTFDSLFGAYFGATRASFDQDILLEPSDQGTDASSMSASASNDATSEHGLGEHDLAELVQSAIASGDARALRLAARLAVMAYAGIEAARPVGISYYLLRTLRALDLEALIDAIRKPAKESATHEMAHLESLGELGARLVQEEYAARAELLRRLIEAEITALLVADRGVASVAGTLRKTPLGDVDFVHATRDELLAIRRALYPLARLLASRLARRRRHRHRGPLDFRATIRRSLSTGGVPIEPRFSAPHPKKPELVVIADVSGSVASFARFTIQLVFAIASQFSKVRSFVFVDGLDEVTGIFRHSASLAEATMRVASEANVTHLDGHSNYGHAFSVFTAHHLRAITSRTDVLVLGDARNNYHAPRPELFGEITRRARRTYWLNPEPRAYWGSGDSIVEAYRPYCDAVFECRNLHQLEEFISFLG